MIDKSLKRRLPVACSTCGNFADALIHKVETYRRVPGGYGHPFAAPADAPKPVAADTLEQERVVNRILFSVLRKRAKSAERERKEALQRIKTMKQETAESMAAIGGTMERLVAEREEAVGQVAGIIKATELCVDSLEEFTTYDYGRGMASDPLVMNAESVIAQAREALATSAPLVAAHDATVLEDAANLAACCHSGGEAAVAIRKLAADLKKGIADDLTKK